MKLKFLGTGTSQGIPVIGCECKVCASQDIKDKRFRTSAILTTEQDKKILIDCGPDFRQQMILNKESRVDAVLITHEHNDHIIGLDDMRPIIFRQGKGVDLYCHERVGNEIKNRFPYAFVAEKYPGAPSFEMNFIDEDKFQVAGVFVELIKVSHYKLDIYGYKFKNLAYITDASFISDFEKKKLKNLDVLILNCIRKTEVHRTHFILEDIIKLNDELKPKKLYLTHISHEFGLHREENSILPQNIELAFDGLEIKF